MSELKKRTQMCGQFTAEDIDKYVTVNGWIAKRRNLGGLIFCDEFKSILLTEHLHDQHLASSILHNGHLTIRLTANGI